MTMTVSDKVAWAEGVLLKPQHFQQLDRYHESLLSARLDAIDALNWGVMHVELDERAVLQGSVAVVGLAAIMPDGTPVCVSDNSEQAAPKQRPLLEHFPAAQPSLLVYIAVPQERAGVNNYAYDGDQLRYALRSRKLPDTARDDRHADVQLAVPNMRILFGDESQEGFCTLPIARLVRDEEGAVVVCRRYIPPCLRVGSSPALARRLELLLTAMISRSRSLSDARRITGEGRVAFTATDVTRYLQLHALNTMLPSIFHVARAREVSPRSAFLLLSQLAGQLATFASDADMTTPLDFDYHDLEATFAAVFDLCEQLLAALDTERYVMCKLKLLEHGRFYADLSDVRVHACSRFLVGVESQLPRAQVIAEVTQRAKLASHGDMEFVQARNVSGIRVAVSERPPGELPARPGLVYFELPTPEDDVYWRHVRKDQNLVVWLPPALDPERCTLRLYGLLD